MMNRKREIQIGTRLVQVESLLTNQIDDEVVMLNLETDSYYGADPVGSRIWTLLAQPLSVAHICEQLQEEYEVEQETCEADVLAFVEKLHAEGLIQIVEE